MPIKWFVVLAQMINFLILVWLLKRFLYKPILDAIDARAKGIAAQLAEANAKKAEAQQERDVFQHKNEVFDQDHAALLKKATDEANAERQRLLDGVRKDAEASRASRQEALRNSQQALNTHIIRWTQNEVFTIARRALTDLAATTLEERMVAIFIDRLGALTGPVKEQMAAAIKAGTQATRVRSAFDLLPAQRQEIETALKEILAETKPVEFEKAPDLVCGIELSANGQKVAWSIADYLATLEKDASQFLQGDARPDASAKTRTMANSNGAGTAGSPVQEATH